MMIREDINRHQKHTHDKRVSFDRRTKPPAGGAEKFKVKRCGACGLTNKELHHAIRTLHTCESGTCFIRGPKFNSDKEIRENVNQYNLKNMNDKGATPNKNRLGIPPRDAALPGANVNHTDHIDSYESEEEYDDVYEDTYSDTIDPDEYNLEDDYEEESDNEETIPETNVAHANIEDGLPEPTVCNFVNEKNIGDLRRPEIFYAARD